MIRKSILIVFVLICGGISLFFFFRKDQPPQSTRLKLLILGVDGMDPAITEQLMGKGKLPHLAALAAAGTYSRLQTTNPAESPVAWASLITGSNPGRTGLFGFLERDPSTYQPVYAPTTFIKGRSMLNFLPIENPRYINNRREPAFWYFLSQHGLRSAVLWCPETFPPDEFNGEMLAGMEVPDIHGSTGTFAFYTSDESIPAIAETVIPLRFENGKAQTSIRGPSNWLTNEQEPLPIPLTLDLLDDHSALSITIDGKTQQMRPREWSEWFEMRFRLNVFTTVTAIGRFYLQSTTPSVKLYLGPLNIDPRNPLFPISSPKQFSEELARSIGLFKTVGWETDTWGVNEGFLDEHALLTDAYETLHKQESIVLHLLEKREHGLFFAVFGGLDRLEHIFWRYRDHQHPFHNASASDEFQKAIENAYIEMDRAIGNILTRVDSQTTVMVLSDHGSVSFRRALNLNTWLVKNGFMRLRGNNDSLPQGTFFPGVDWRQTKAYALGIGGIYLNVVGREGEGMVREGEEYEKVRDEIIQKLTSLRDEKTGRAVMHRVHKREEIYGGSRLGAAPDLIVGLIPGYRVSQVSSLGGFEPDVLTDNLRRWSGDHVSVDPHFVPGVLFTNRRVQFSDPPSLIDIAPTIFGILGFAPPDSMDGQNLFAPRRFVEK